MKQTSNGVGEVYDITWYPPLPPKLIIADEIVAITNHYGEEEEDDELAKVKKELSWLTKMVQPEKVALISEDLWLSLSTSVGIIEKALHDYR